MSTPRTKSGAVTLATCVATSSSQLTDGSSGRFRFPELDSGGLGRVGTEATRAGVATAASATGFPGAVVWRLGAGSVCR
jgi:hypothetical protein